MNEYNVLKSANYKKGWLLPGFTSEKCLAWNPPFRPLLDVGGGACLFKENDMSKEISGEMWKTYIKGQKYDALKQSHVKLVGAIKAALRVKKLWLRIDDSEEEYRSEAAALSTMLYKLEQALKEAEAVE